MVEKKIIRRTRKRILLTKDEKRIFKEMVSRFGGGRLVDKSEIRRRILSARQRKTGRVTARDMEDMFGY